jgi:hypothetical protein
MENADQGKSCGIDGTNYESIYGVIKKKEE